MSRKLRVRIAHDFDVESPCDNDGAWKLYSFSRRHSSFKHPDNFFNEAGKPQTWLANKIRRGLAFVLGYHEHGNCQWALSGEQWPCPWDSVDVAGVLVWEHDPKDMGGKTVEDRAADARVFLDEYTNWCNGECYVFSVETEGGELVDSCGGFIGVEYMFDVIAESIEPGDEWAFVGEYRDVASRYENKLRAKPETVAV